MVNSAGQVIGMNTAASTGPRRPSRSTAAFAIPIDRALTIARQVQGGESSTTVHTGDRAILGVQVIEHNGSTAGRLTVVAVEDGSPAAGAGMHSGDVITAVDSKSVSSPDDLLTVLDSHRPGDRARVAWTGP